MYLRALITVTTVLVTGSWAIWPQPAKIETGSHVLWLDASLQATLRCRDDGVQFEDAGYVHYEKSSISLFEQLTHVAQGFVKKTRTLFEGGHMKDKSEFSENSIVQAAVHDTIEAIHDSKFVPWKLHKRDANFEPDANDARQYVSSIQVQQRVCPTSDDFSPANFFSSDESHEVLIDMNGTVVLKSNSSIGTIRALQTLRQLFFAHSSSAGAYTPFAPVSIVDQPRWPHRGLSIDIARNPFDPADLLRTLDAMALAKMSRLHVHATDSQSWPIEIPSLPELAQKGAYHPGLVWSAADLREIQMYGASNGISVFVEIDVPGHTASIAHAFPQLIAAFNELDWSTFAAEPLSGQLKLNHTGVATFMATILDDLFPRISPYTSLYHVGGDEVNQAAYLLDETVKTDKVELLQPLLQSCIDYIIDMCAKAGLQPIVWEEMLLDWNLTLPMAGDERQLPPTLVQVWRNSERIEEVLKKGHRVIFGDYHFWYLDCGFGGFLDPYPLGRSPPGVPYNTSGGIPSKLKQPYLDYCAPFHNWRAMYTYNPLANISAKLQGGLEGGEVLMWSEQTDTQDLDSKLWPRVAAAAEVLWTGVREDSMLQDATRRLGEWRERAVVDLGVRMSPVTMTWCLMEGGCEL